MSELDRRFLPPGDLPPLHRPFWDGLREHLLLVQRCPNDHLRFIPTEICPRCGSQEWEWQPLSGRGEVYTYTVVHRGPTLAYQADIPYVIAHVALAEGPRMIANLTGCAPAAVCIGMAVQIEFYDAGEGWTLYRFVPAAGGENAHV
ncbi:Zn-ribbon domain-containing OB-fold protein [uncultured Sphingomonas sp.]|uniref:Zn-ribbon domain-containing OB-fold protein n=1 Tax=uncultured Sphingomonas sp. TaxID=158754 RepID=UPI0035C946CB